MQTIGVLATYATQNTIYLRRHYAGLNTTGDLHRIIASAGIAKGRSSGKKVESDRNKNC